MVSNWTKIKRLLLPEHGESSPEWIRVPHREEFAGIQDFHANHFVLVIQLGGDVWTEFQAPAFRLVSNCQMEYVFLLEISNTCFVHQRSLNCWLTCALRFAIP